MYIVILCTACIVSTRYEGTYINTREDDKAISKSTFIHSVILNKQQFMKIRVARQQDPILGFDWI